MFFTEKGQISTEQKSPISYESLEKERRFCKEKLIDMAEISEWSDACGNICRLSDFPHRSLFSFLQLSSACLCAIRYCKYLNIESTFRSTKFMCLIVTTMEYKYKSAPKNALKQPNNSSHLSNLQQSGNSIFLQFILIQTYEFFIFSVLNFVKLNYQEPQPFLKQRKKPSFKVSRFL